PTPPAFPRQGAYDRATQMTPSRPYRLYDANNRSTQTTPSQPMRPVIPIQRPVEQQAIPIQRPLQSVSIASPMKPPTINKKEQRKAARMNRTNKGVKRNDRGD